MRGRRGARISQAANNKGRGHLLVWRKSIFLLSCGAAERGGVFEAAAVAVRVSWLELEFSQWNTYLALLGLKRLLPK